MNPPDPRKVRFAGLRLKTRAPERVTLSNGMTAFLLEDRDVPAVGFGAHVRCGNVYSPAGMPWLTGATMSVMRTGGGSILKGDALDEELDRLGAWLNLGADDDVGWITGWSLKRHLNRAVELFADVVRRPRFPESKIELEKSQQIEWLKRMYDEPGGAVHYLFSQLVYGSTTVWGRTPDRSSISRMTKRDLDALHRRYFHPKALILVAAGHFKTAEMTRILERHFGDWKPKPLDIPGLEPLRTDSPGRVCLAPRKIEQSHFRIGHLGIKLSDPDYFALRLMNMVLGSGTASNRLFRDIRTKRGWAYSIWSNLWARVLDVGLTYVGGSTKYESTAGAVGAVLGHLRALQRKEPSASELKLAKAWYENQLAFEFQPAWEVAWRHAGYEYNGLPQNWLSIEREGILAATGKDVMRAARAHLRPDNALILVLGDPDRCRQSLAKFGKVKTVSYASAFSAA